MKIEFNDVKNSFNRDKKILNKLIEEDIKDEYGRDILMISSAQGEVSIVKYIINQRSTTERKINDLYAAILFTPRDQEVSIAEYTDMFYDILDSLDDKELKNNYLEKMDKVIEKDTEIKQRYYR